MIIFQVVYSSMVGMNSKDPERNRKVLQGCEFSNYPRNFVKSVVLQEQFNRLKRTP